MIIVLLAALLGGVPAFPNGFDLVIKNGRKMDPETGFDAVANVGINNGFVMDGASKHYLNAPDHYDTARDELGA